jgi:hypothetical protein
MEVSLCRYLGCPCFLAHVAFYSLSLHLWLMVRAQKEDWTIVFPITSVFTEPIISDEALCDLVHLALASNLCSYVLSRLLASAWFASSLLLTSGLP